MDTEQGQEEKLAKWRLLSDEQFARIIQTTGKCARKRIRYTIFYTIRCDYIDDFARILRLLPPLALSEKLLEKYADYALRSRRCSDIWEVLKNYGWVGYKEPEWLLMAIKYYNGIGWMLENGGAVNTPFGDRELTRTGIWQDQFCFHQVSPKARILDVALMSDDIPLSRITILLRAGALFGALKPSPEYQPDPYYPKCVYAMRVLVYQGLLSIKRYPLPKELTRMIADMILTTGS